MGDRIRLAVVASHPIQYYAPFYRAIAKRGDVRVRAFFASRIGLDNVLDVDMGVEVAWNMDLLGGFEHEFLEGAERIRTTDPLAVDNPRVGAALAKFDPDVVLLHGYTRVTMLKALLWCRRHDVPTLMISDSSLHAGTSALMRFVKRLVLPLVFRQFEGFLCISDSNAAYFEAFGVPAERRFRVPTMVDESFWDYRKRRDGVRTRVRAEFGLRDSDLAVLFVGKLIARKRPGDLLAALCRLRATKGAGRRIKILFAGDGELRAELEAKAKQERLPAEFFGFVNIDRLPAFYCAADVLVHPAEIETFGVIVLEAAILGLPLVLSDKVGAIGSSSIARPGRNVLIYPCGDVDALSDLLARLAEDASALARLSAESSEISKEHDGGVSVAGTVDAIERCLRRTLSERNQTRAGA